MVKTQATELFKVGDKAQFRYNAPLKEEYPFKHEVWYDGVIVKHVDDSITLVEIENEHGVKEEASLSYGSFNSGYESARVILTLEEFNARKENYINAELRKAAIEYKKRIDYLLKLDFHVE